MLTLKPRIVLRRLRAMFQTEACWCTGFMAAKTTVSGPVPVDVLDPLATCRCLVGGLNAVLGEHTRNTRKRPEDIYATVPEAVSDYLMNVEPKLEISEDWLFWELPARKARCLAGWQDRQDSFAPVGARIDAALVAAEAEDLPTYVIIERALEIFRRPNSWLAGRLAGYRNPLGQVHGCSLDDPTACCYCLTGAIQKVRGIDPRTVENLYEAPEELIHVLRQAAEKLNHHIGTTADYALPLTRDLYPFAIWQDTRNDVTLVIELLETALVIAKQIYLDELTIPA